MTTDHAAIRKRLDAATPGPWTRYSTDFRDQRSHSVKGPGGAVRAFTGYGPDGGSAFTDADLIAHAPTDLAVLLAEVERLRSSADEWWKLYDESQRENEALRVDLHRAKTQHDLTRDCLTAALDAHTARGDANSAPEGDGADEGAGGAERGAGGFLQVGETPAETGALDDLHSVFGADHDGYVAAIRQAVLIAEMGGIPDAMLEPLLRLAACGMQPSVEQALVAVGINTRPRP